ncbi:MAG: hypothetical protein Ct9H300mP30_2410 [Methanobacteriota archaeon]|nr:MAG: hypothetical protein Ct9H300mP30_2410 [Euryarchaeota archaeon]
MADSVEVESKYAPPLAECAHCDHMLPQGLGEKECKVCGAVCRVSHQPTIDSLTESPYRAHTVTPWSSPALTRDQSS